MRKQRNVLRFTKAAALRAGAIFDLLELSEEQVDLFGFAVKVRLDAQVNAGTVVAEEFTAVALATYVGAAGELEDVRTTALACADTQPSECEIKWTQDSSDGNWARQGNSLSSAVLMAGLWRLRPWPVTPIRGLLLAPRHSHRVARR